MAHFFEVLALLMTIALLERWRKEHVGGRQMNFF
jgi:hypothetical protein